MATEFINGLIHQLTKVTGLRTKFPAMENTPGMIKGHTRAIGMIITCMGKAFTNGPMAESMKEITSMTKSMDLAYTLIPMVAHIRVIGPMASSMVRVFSLLHKATKGKESGTKEREFNGFNLKMTMNNNKTTKNKCNSECENCLN